MKPAAARWLLPGFLSLSALGSDYFSKTWANSHLQYGEAQPFIPGLLKLNLTRNTGGAFGIGRGHGAFMTILALAIVLSIILWVWKRERSQNRPGYLERCGIGLIVGGALGNLTDRFMRGEVTDFLDFSFIDFPVFNLADALIDLGAGLVILGALFLNKERKSADSGGEME